MTRLHKNHFALIVFVFPAVVLFSVLLIYPIIQTCYMSFFSWNGIAVSPLEFVGFDNFITIFGKPAFWRAMKNVGLFVVVGFLFQMPLSFVLSLFTTGKFKGLSFFKTAFFIPVILPMTAVGIMWTFILWPSGGLLNSVLEAIGAGGIVQDWLGINVGPLTVPIVNMWVYAGLNMIIFSAGMVGIPKEIYESAEIDGAAGIRKTFSITIPLMKDTFKTYAILCLTGCLKVFDIIFVMTNGGPNGATDVPATLLYYSAYRYQKFGEANAIGVTIMVLGLLVSLTVNKFLKSENAN